MRSMMILRVLFVILLASACNLIHVNAPTPVSVQTPDEQIDEMLELSGLTKQVEQMPAAIKSGFIQQQQRGQSKLTPENYDRLLKIVTDSYNASDLKQSMVDYFTAHYDHDHVSAELTILHSPLSKKMTELETRASTPEALQEIQKYVQQLKSEPPAPERMALIGTLDRVAGTTDLNVEILVSASMAYIRVFNAISPREKRLNQDQLEEVAGRIRKELWNPIEQATTVTILYMYRSIPDTELKEYIKLYESETAGWFKQLTKAALVNALTTAAEKAGNQMAKMSPKAST